MMCHLSEELNDPIRTDLKFSLGFSSRIIHHDKITVVDITTYFIKLYLIISYEDVTFKPDQTIIREEMVVLLSRIST